MKLVFCVLLITFDIAFGGKCLPDEVITPCKCQDGKQIKCQATTKEIKNAFRLMNENLNGGIETHFRTIELDLVYDNGERALDDDTFSDITFQELIGNGIKKLGTNLFIKSASFIKRVNLQHSYLQNSPPNYAIWQALGTLKNVASITLGLNYTEIPTNAISKMDNAPNLLSLDLNLGSLRRISFTVRSKAFDNLNDLEDITIAAPNSGGQNNNGNIIFEKEAFMSSKTRNRPLQLNFIYTRLDGDLFDEQTFAGVNSLFISIFVDLTLIIC